MEAAITANLLSPKLADFSLEQSLPRAALNLETKTRSNLFPWNGQFSPDLIGLLLDAYAGKAAHVIDPFMGSGTVLIEAARRDLRATGADVNPAPYKIARLYTLINMPAAERSRALSTLDEKLNALIAPDWMASPNKARPTQEIDAEILAWIGAGKAFEQIILSALVVLLDLSDSPLSANRFFAKWDKLKDRCNSFPVSERPISVLNADARSLPLRKRTAGLVVTSPPYINVFNYHQKYRRSVEALGWDLLHVARSEIGANRKYRGNRFMTVVQYCIDMADAIREMCRVTKQGSRLIIVIGRESNVRKTSFSNSDIIISLVTHCLGLQVLGRDKATSLL